MSDIREQAIEYIGKFRKLDEDLMKIAPKGSISEIATGKCLEYWDLAIESIKSQRTGHWKYTTHYARPYRVCSVCGCEREDDHSTGWNYCPNCGVKMRRKENKE